MRKSLAAALWFACAAPAGTITGIVRDAITRAPVAGAHLDVTSSLAATDSEGRFTIPNVAPGLHWISAFDEIQGGRGGAYVLVKTGEETSTVEIAIKPGGAISGRVIDEDRQPVAGVAVLLLESRFEFGRIAYARYQTAVTGADGAYRLTAVPPERAFLLLAKKPLEAGPEKRGRAFSPSYFPGYRYAQDAQPVTLTPGENREAVDIRLPSAPSYCLEGVVEGADGTPLGVVAILEQEALVAGSAFNAALARLSSKGRFRLCGFHPGDYQLIAREGEGNVNRSDRVTANADVTVTDRDLTDLKLVAQSPLPFSGDAVWDPPPAKTSEKPVYVTLIKAIDDDRNAEAAGPHPGMSGSFSYNAAVSVPGSFRFHPTPADDYQLEFAGLPPGCYVKEASFAGADGLHRLLRLAPGIGDARLHIALACDGASLTTRVTDRDGHPVSHVNLYAMPAAAASAAALQPVLRQAAVEAGLGSFLQPLPPGKYLVLATDLELDGSAEPILKLWRARSLAKEIEIGPHAVLQVTLETVAIR